jgi:hypothetical protein
VGGRKGEKRARKRSASRKEAGKAAQKVEQVESLGERESRLWSRVVPVRGAPRMKIGEGWSGCARTREGG